MQTFQIQITETLQRIITFQANTEEKAFQKVRERYENETIVLDASDHTSTDFSILNSSEVDESVIKSQLIQELIEYLIHDEKKHFEAFEKAPQDHIYLKLVELQRLTY